MLTGEELGLRKEVIAGAPDLRALRDRLVARAATVVGREPGVPEYKGMLTADGGICPEDRSRLQFDPWSPTSHRCPRCGRVFSGERHDRRWAWLAHLWLAERIAELATVGLVAEDEAALAWAATMVAEYGRRYATFPNVDNVLGPSRLFSSTYLESVWLTSYLAGAYLLREGDALDQAGIEAASTVAEEAAGLIGEFDEGLSNRQTWHNAALAAVAAWFEDADLAQRAVEGPRGLVGHFVDGFGPDGMWYEGENYHLFALRGLLTGADWARHAGVDLFEEKAGQDRLAAALRAPILSALPDATFPARKDARFGVSLAQPMYLELWERGAKLLVSTGHLDKAGELAGWLRHLYALPAPVAEPFDSYLHEAGEEPPATRGRADLSWWMLAAMLPELPGEAAAWHPASALLPVQGLAILRDQDRYASVECGEYGGGHGHPDRLHLTLHARGIHWLADPGTGSYVSRDLFWYRSTLAHNAPRVDGVSQPAADARAEMYDVNGRWGWVRAKCGGFTRTVVAGPSTITDVLEFAADEEHLVELPWHPEGELQIVSAGRWGPAELSDEFVSGTEQFIPDRPGTVAWRATVTGTGRVLEGIFDGTGSLIRARGPGRPGETGERPFLLLRQQGRYVRFASVVAFDESGLRSARFAPGEIVVETGSGTVIHRQTSEGWDVTSGETHIALRGHRREALAPLDLPVVGSELAKYTPPEATVFHLAEAPGLDGTLDGFVTDAALHLDHDDQYRRTESPYPGPDEFSARAWLGWDERALYLAVEVLKTELTFRRTDAPPLLLDNESDLIHSDGLQVYLEPEGQGAHGWLIVPDPESSLLQIRGVVGTPARADSIRGAWQATGDGYLVSIAIALPGWPPEPGDSPPRFDLMVNEMRPGRLRRLGQLVWTGGGGWCYLRGDRQDSARFGRLLLR